MVQFMHGLLAVQQELSATLKTSVEVLSKIACPSPRVAVAGVAAVSQPAKHDEKRAERDVPRDTVETRKLLSSL